MALGKGDGLGVLDSYEQMNSSVKGIRKNLKDPDPKKGIKAALKNVKHLKSRLDKSRADAKKLEREAKGLIKVLTKTVLPLIDNKNKKSAGDK